MLESLLGIAGLFVPVVVVILGVVLILAPGYGQASQAAESADW